MIIHNDFLEMQIPKITGMEVSELDLMAPHILEISNGVDRLVLGFETDDDLLDAKTTAKVRILNSLDE